ncbi:hypothetical protein NE619_06595 [Anaerovorax odorimutans]|uniref:DUF4240 domain-containing protein n=1 Tax=Anaerovorax odorimutans TaxID=109327 RepID=A0ABT1RMJ4_9FIRM|nr:hypothetical protein [Anaerovorax odorimutans]MCQ4636392.1 hypothetical protein [Anaerovorax odorimutans]
MAYKLPLKTINRWLVKYGGKKQLYIKDVFNDLVWIYLINANLRDSDSGNNYYRKFDECSNSIKEIYNHMNEEIAEDDAGTADLDNDIKNIVFDPDYVALYLDDSMINYLTSGEKYVPKNKKTYISIGLALGMIVKDLDIYLKMMGYAPLDGTCLEEGLLINALEKWEGEHPLQRKFKEKYFDGNDEIKLDKQDEKQVVNDMLGLRNDLKEIYEAFPKSAYNKETTTKFPYMNE